MRRRGRVHTCNSTQYECEIAGTSIAPLVEMQRSRNMFNSVQPAECDLRQIINQARQLTRSTFRAACGMRQSMNRPYTRILYFLLLANSLFFAY